MRIIPLLLGTLCTLPAWGATGTSDPETWYARPATACPTNGDGLAYNCAASGGASGAFTDLDNFIWTTTDGIDDGDTLKLCGNFGQAAANTANTNLAMMQIAGSGSEGSEIIFDGNCAAQGDLAVAVLDGDYTSGSVIRARENTYLRFRNLDLSGAKDTGMVFYQVAASDVAVAKHITVESSVRITDIHNGSGNKIAITWSGTHVNIGDYSTTGDYLYIEDIGTDALFAYSGGTQTIDGVHISEVSQDDGNGDCVQLQRKVDGTLVDNLYCDHSDVDSKQCVVASTLDSQAEAYTIQNMTCLLAGGTLSNGVYAEGQATVLRSYIKDAGNYSLVAALNNSADLTAVGNILEGATSGCIDGHKTSAGGTVIAYHNTMHNCGLAAVDLTDATASHIIGNNNITGTGAVGILRGASGTTDSYNNVYGPTIAYSDNGVEGVAGTGGTAVDPQYVGGTTLDTPEAFRPKVGSQIIHSGARLGNYFDYQGQRFAIPPTRGAIEARGRIPAATRIPAIR